MRLDAGIRLEQAQLTPGLAATLRHAASMHNPVFYERQRMRASTWNIPRFLHCYQETIDGGLILPRGMLDTVTSLAAQAGSRLNIADQRSPGTGAGLHLHRDPDISPAGRASRNWPGMTSACSSPRPEPGKTVIACAVIAARQVSTLVLVDRKALADQWRARISEFLGVKAGQLGGGRTKLRGTIDIVTLQTLARRDDIAQLTAGYGLVVADECHHVPAAAFERRRPADRRPALARADRHALPARQARRPDRPASRPGPAHHLPPAGRSPATRIPSWPSRPSLT